MLKDIYDDSKRRVAVYIRTATCTQEQEDYFKLEKERYTRKINNAQNCTLVGIYADIGVSGSSFNHRNAFNRMIEDCKAEKIDMIVVKSVSRFSRNIVDVINITRQLAELKNPVEVYFESENISSLRISSEVVNLFTEFAQKESSTKSKFFCRYHNKDFLDKGINDKLGYINWRGERYVKK